MKGTILLAHLLVIWTMTVLIHSQPNQVEIKVEESSGKIKLSCPKDFSFELNNTTTTTITLEYKDHALEHICKGIGNQVGEHKIYVKIRTCDNCIELDIPATLAMVLGDLVATVLIGVAVYGIASQPKATRTSGKKTSSKMGLINNEASPNLDPSGHYQLLNKRRMDKSEYSTLPERR